jgi:prepilin-type N-terminal cleavage/methylation domain-containing protein/prepilin-type processing-associated H-X9-DG protein
MQQIQRRHGFTLVEFLVSLAILFLLATFLIPSVHHARENARSSTCRNNLRQLGLGLHNYHESYERFPSSGKGTLREEGTAAPSVNPHQPGVGETAFFPTATFYSLLPYMSCGPVYNSMTSSVPYNSSDPNFGPQNRKGSADQSPAYLCSSNGAFEPDSMGYGQIDYAVTAYTDLPLSAESAAAWAKGVGLRERCSGALHLNCTPMREISDGTSYTIAIAESAGREGQHRMGGVRSVYLSPASTQDNCLGIDGKSTGYRCPNRWADPANGMGISGPADGSSQLINGSSRSPGGARSCRWTTENCGPNDEIFSFHPGGAQCVFADGAVRFLSEKIDSVTLARLVARSDGLEVEVPSPSP